MLRLGLRAHLKALGCDTRGVAAVEFAFLAPILILFYFSMVEFCQGYMALKRTGHVASMVADLVSQADALSKDQVEEILDIGDVIMRPFPTTDLNQRVSSVTRISATQYEVNWSVERGMDGEKLTVADAEIPSDMLADGQSVIVTEATYDYKSPFDQFAPDVTHFSRMAYLRPRTAEVIACTGC